MEHVVEFVKAQLSWRLCLGSETQSKSIPTTTGILTFSLKGHRSFHVFTSAFNARRKVCKRMKREELRERGREGVRIYTWRDGGEAGLWEVQDQKEKKRPKQSISVPRSEPRGPHSQLLSHTDTEHGCIEIDTVCSWLCHILPFALFMRSRWPCKM